MTVRNFPLARQNTLIILNGNLDILENFPTKNYQQILVADGAWNTVKKQPWSGVVTHIMGDGDSIIKKPKQFIDLIDQNFTDFEKILQHLCDEKIRDADVIGASGGEMDHFLGNLSVAAKYVERVSLTFFDSYQCYFYQSGDVQLQGVLGKTISLYPFPEATMTSQGLRYEMQALTLDLYNQQSLRNVAIADTVTLKITGAVWVFLALIP